MIPFFVGIVSCLGVFFRSRYSLGLEIFALRQQLGVLERKNPRMGGLHHPYNWQQAA